MKTHEIQRGITSRHGRAGGDAPNIGQVHRMRGAELPAGSRRFRSRRATPNPERKKVILRWSALLSGATLIVMGAAVTIWVLPHLSKNPADIAGVTVNHESQVRVISKFPSPSREESLNLVKRAITNRDPGKVESLFRLGSASTSEILDFLSGTEKQHGLVDRYDWLSSMDVGGLLAEGVLVVWKGAERPVERLAFLTPDSAGVWKLDFEAFARSVTPSWKELLENGAQQALVRVLVGHDVYYNGPFSDEKQWVCYGIATPDREDLLRGYCKVGSPQEESMKKLFTEGRRLSRATLEIRRVKEGDPRQFEITRLVAQDWIVAATPENKS